MLVPVEDRSGKPTQYWDHSSLFDTCVLNIFSCIGWACSYYDCLLQACRVFWSSAEARPLERLVVNVRRMEWFWENLQRCMTFVRASGSRLVLQFEFIFSFIINLPFNRCIKSIGFYRTNAPRWFDWKHKHAFIDKSIMSSSKLCSTLFML